MTTTEELFQLLAGLSAGLVAAVVLAWVAWRRRSRGSAVDQPAVADGALDRVEIDEPPARQALSPPAAANADVGSLVDGMLAHDRYALLLRRQLVSNLTLDQFAAAREALHEQMSLVPEGDVTLEVLADDDDEPGRGAVWHVGGLFLDRHPVTNRQYRQFVAGGGYEQMSIWDPQIWPAVLDFVDISGCPGPRFWKNGRYANGEDHHPVVGVSWYEAAAYARWVGKRLPSEEEWVKAGSWPVPITDSRQAQRKFPWGDTMDRARCNLWGSGPGQIVPVTDFASGVSVGGVYQLIGNTWEWTTGNFGEHAPRDLTLPVPMKSIRGGAFDTYFEHQATCQFQSGEGPLSRKHNIGFRCALSTCDVAAAQPAAGNAAQPAAGNAAPHSLPGGESAEVDDGPADRQNTADHPAPIDELAGELLALAEGAE